MADPALRLTEALLGTDLRPLTVGVDRRHAAVAHPVARALCEAAGMALVSTSANPAGRPPARRPLMVRKHFGAALDYILPGPLGPQARPSEIRDAATGRVVRAG